MVYAQHHADTTIAKADAGEVVQVAKAVAVEDVKVVAKPLVQEHANMVVPVKTNFRRLFSTNDNRY